MIAVKQAWRKWAIPAEPVEDLYGWQNGLCAWCGGKGADRGLVEDHCHFTGLVRGWLCRHCNTVEGKSFDPEWDQWRSGENPANATRHFVIYYGWGGTPLTSQGALHYYSHAEKQAWFKQVVKDMEAGADWPEDAPWIEAAAARRDAIEAEVRAVMNSWSFLRLPDGGAA